MEGERVFSMDGYGLSIGIVGIIFVIFEVVGVEVGYRVIIVGILMDVLEYVVFGVVG